MVKFQPSTLAMWVRFPLPAPIKRLLHLHFIKTMRALLSRPTQAWSAILLMAISLTSSASGNSCADITRDVTAAVTNDPSKVLMIVEDALVINESCAGDIVKAAILASKADASLANQIIQTAISVAPKMASVITDSATSVSPAAASAVAVVDPALTMPVISGKNPEKNPLPITPEPVFEPMLPSIRGVYLIQPPASGIVPGDPRRRKNNNNPMSPSQNGPGYN